MTENNARVSCKLENQDNELKKKKKHLNAEGNCSRVVILYILLIMRDHFHITNKHLIHS